MLFMHTSVLKGQYLAKILHWYQYHYQCLLILMYEYILRTFDTGPNMRPGLGHELSTASVRPLSIPFYAMIIDRRI